MKQSTCTPSPTYAHFRLWVTENGLSIEEIAKHTQADKPYETAERILVHLAGTHWDHEPLPYPRLCALYAGTTDVQPEANPPAKPPEPPLQPEQFTVRNDFASYWIFITLDKDAPRQGLKLLCHIIGGKQTDAQTWRLPYEVVCRLAERQAKAHRGPALKGIFDDGPEEPPKVLRLCICGQELTGQASQRYWAAKCRQRVSRANPQRIAKKRGSKSVTAITVRRHRVLPLLGATRRADGSVRDVFSEMPSFELLARVSHDSQEFNRRQTTRGRLID